MNEVKGGDGVNKEPNLLFGGWKIEEGGLYIGYNNYYTVNPRRNIKCFIMTINVGKSLC